MPTEVDVLVCAGVTPCPSALGRFAPGADRQPPLALATATSMRVVYGVHGNAAGGGPNALPPICPRLALLDVLVLPVGDFSNGRSTSGQDPPLLA